MDGLLNELRGLLACVQEFLAFLHRTAATAVHPKPLPRDLMDILADGQHTRAVKELQSAYLSLEAAYIQRSVAKAIEWDSLLPVCIWSLYLLMRRWVQAASRLYHYVFSWQRCTRVPTQSDLRMFIRSMITTLLLGACWCLLPS